MSYYQRDKLSIKSNQILANLFADLILLSEKVQSFRQILASVPYYDCIELFRLIDRDKKGFLAQKDFEHLIGGSHKKLVTYVFSWFDQSKMGEISKLEFISFLLPRKDLQLKEIVARRIEQPQDQQFLDTTSTITEQLRIFTEMLNEMIRHELKIIQLRRKLMDREDYSLKGVLNSIDIANHEWVSVSDIYKHLQNYAIQATKSQIAAFLEIVDCKMEGKIKINQLGWIVEGLENKDNIYLPRVKAANKQNRAFSKSRRKSQSLSAKDQIKEKFPASQQQQKSLAFSSKKSKRHLSNSFHPGSSQTQKARQLQKYSQNKQNVISEFSAQKTVKSAAVSNDFERILKKLKEAQIQANRKDNQLKLTQKQIQHKSRQQYQQSVSKSSQALEEIQSHNKNRYDQIYQQELAKRRACIPTSYATYGSPYRNRGIQSYKVKEAVDSSSKSRYNQLLELAQGRWKNIMAEPASVISKYDKVDPKVDRYSNKKFDLIPGFDHTSSSHSNKRNLIESSAYRPSRSTYITQNKYSHLQSATPYSHHPINSKADDLQCRNIRTEEGSTYVSKFGQDYSASKGSAIKSDYMMKDKSAAFDQSLKTDPKTQHRQQTHTKVNQYLSSEKYRTPMYSGINDLTGFKSKGLSTEAKYAYSDGLQRKL